MDSSQVIARFEAEREALSLMDHPSIARVLDAGSTRQGHPYFVMELICGVPITEYCDRNKLPVARRLDLFVQVCRAVQHAHQKGIIHRDIKPSNVLVTQHDDKPVPKVIDFGVAKAIRQPLTDHSIYTGLFQAVGTLAYMSPEQAQLSGLNIDTRADIYGLGVLLYELLTGATPFDQKQLASAALDEACRIIREQEPPKPSTKFSELGDRTASVSEGRNTTATDLAKSIRGDLDWIVMKSLEKERSRRYETASGFAIDIERYLTNEPIEARPPSVVYRCRKFVRRHRAIVAGVSATLTALILGTVATVVALIYVLESEQRLELALEGEREARAKVEQTMSAYCDELKRSARDVAMSGDEDQTEEAIGRAKQFGASDKWADFVRAQFAVFHGEWKDAVRLLRGVIDRDPKDLPAVALLCEAYIFNKDLESCMQLRGKLEELTPKNGLEELLKAKAARFGRPDKHVSIEMIDSLSNWRISPWARRLRSEILTTMAELQRDPILAEEAVEEALVAYKLLPDSAPCFLSLMNAQKTCHSVYRERGDKVNSDRHKSEMLKLCKQADTLGIRCGGLVKAVEAEFFESIGEIEVASQRWITLTEENLGGWNLVPAVYFFQRHHDFDAALNVWENGKMAPFGQLLSATILLEFPNRRSKTRQDMRNLADELPEVCRHFAVAAMCMVGDLDTAIEVSKDLLESNITENVNMLEFLAGRKNEQEYVAAVRRDGENLGDAHLVMGLVHLGHHHLKRAKECFSNVQESDDATVGALEMIDVLLQRMNEDENWPHLLVESSDGQSASSQHDSKM